MGYEYSLRLSDNSSLSYFAHIKNIFREPFATFSHVAMLLYGRFFAKSKIPPLVKPVSKYFNLDIHCEQSPSDDSCISLSSSKDCFGLNNIEVSWRPCQSDLDNLSENIRELVSCIGEKCESYEKLSPDQIKDDILRHGAFGGHFIGTAKMGRDPDTSVVDSDLKLHSSSKVYVLSSAVFPTSSHANPTLTIVALAHRLAKHILREEYD